MKILSPEAPQQFCVVLNPCKGSLLAQENPSPALQNVGVTEKVIPKVLPSFIPIKPMKFPIQETGEGFKFESTG